MSTATEGHGVDTNGTFEEVCDRAAALGGARVKIIRGIGAKERLLEIIDAADYDLEEIQRRWGGGEYKMELRAPRGAYIRRQSEKLHGESYETLFGEQDQEDDVDQEAELELAGRYVTFQDFQALATRLEAGVKKAVEEVKENAPAYNKAATSPLDPMTMALSLMQGMQGMVDTAVDPLRKELRRREDREREATGGVQEGFTKGVDFMLKLAPTIMGAEGGGGAPSSNLDRLSGVLIDLIQNRTVGGGAPAPAGGAPAPPPGAAPATSSSSALIDHGKLPEPPPFWVPILEGSLEELLAWAGDGKDPWLCAAWSMDGIPPNLYARIRGELTRPGMREELYRTSTAAAAARSWLDQYFAELVEGIRTELEGEDGSDDAKELDPTKRPGSPDDAPPDAASSPG